MVWGDNLVLGDNFFFAEKRFFSSHLPILDVIKANVFYGEIYGENNDDNVIITMMVDMFENKGDEHMLPSPFWDRGLAQLAIYMQHHNDDDDGGGDDGDDGGVHLYAIYMQHMP